LYARSVASGLRHIPHAQRDRDSRDVLATFPRS